MRAAYCCIAIVLHQQSTYSAISLRLTHTVHAGKYYNDMQSALQQPHQSASNAAQQMYVAGKAQIVQVLSAQPSRHGGKAQQAR